MEVLKNNFSGAVMAAYIQYGISAVHMITASIMSAIGTIGACKIFMPDIEPSETKNMVLEKEQYVKQLNCLNKLLG